jgi:DNA-binding transcriptional LysR family regulator
MIDPITRKGLSLDRLRAFLEVYEAGGIARAAPAQPVRQSQLSRQLSELEGALAHALFVRAGRRLLPTDAGRRLARVVRELFTGLADTIAITGPHRVRVAAGDSMLAWVLLPALKQLRAECPEVQLEVRAAVGAPLVRGLEEHELDLGLMRAGEPAPTLKTLRIGKVSYALFAARQQRDPRRAPLAIPTSETSLLPALAKLGHAAVECETFPQVAAAVRSGEVAGVLPSYANRELATPHYHRTELPELGFTAMLLAWRQRLDEVRPEVKPVRRAIEQLVREALAATP